MIFNYNGLLFIYDIAAPTFDEAVDTCSWKPPVAFVPAKEEELEFPEIPCTGEAQAEVPTADNKTSSGVDLDPVNSLPSTPTEQPILTPEVQPIPPSTQPQVPLQQQEVRQHRDSQPSTDTC